MNKLKFAQITGWLCIISSLLVTLLGGLNVIYPYNHFLLKLYDVTNVPSSDISEMFLVLKIFQIMIWIISMIPFMLGIFCYYLAGGIGEKLSGKIIMAIAAISGFLVAISTMLTLLSDKPKSWNLILLVVPLYFLITSIVFTVTALIVQNVNLWKRLIPFLSIILSVFSMIILSLVFQFVDLIIRFLLGLRASKQTLAHASNTDYIMLGALGCCLFGLMMIEIKKEQAPVKQS